MKYSIARVLLAQARFREAEEFLQGSLTIYEREKGEDCIECSHALTRLGSLYIQLNQLTKSEAAFARSLRIREEKYGSNHARVGQTLKHMVFNLSCY